MQLTKEPGWEGYKTGYKPRPDDGIRTLENNHAVEISFENLTLWKTGLMKDWMDDRKGRGKMEKKGKNTK